MHQLGLAHLDIKPENIYVIGDMRYKIGDFGLIADNKDERDIQEGDSRYLAQELLNCDPKDCNLQKGDVFSLGATIYALAIMAPLPENGEEWHAIRNGNIKSIPYSAPLKELILAMLHSDPAKRPTIKQVLSCDLVAKLKPTYAELEEQLQFMQSQVQLRDDKIANMQMEMQKKVKTPNKKET